MERIKLNKLPEELDEAKVFSVDGGNHLYTVEKLGKDGVEGTVDINFIKGGRNSDDCEAGILDAQLVEILIDRTVKFEEQFKTGENLGTINLLRQVLELMNNRTISRHERGVLGNSGEDYKQVD